MTFIDGERVGECAVEHAIIRNGGEIAFDFDYGLPGEPDVYTVALIPADSGYLEGQFSVGSGNNKASGKVTCRRYQGVNGVALAGYWYEDGNRYDWFAELFFSKSRD